MKTAYQKNIELQGWIAKRLGVDMSPEDVNSLRRAEMTLHRWCERECGDSNNYASFGLERDEETGKPYQVIRPYDSNKARRYRVPDLENGALRRIAAICKGYGLHFYYQTDCRGCSLYIGSEPLTAQTYSGQGLAMCA